MSPVLNETSSRPSSADCLSDKQFVVFASEKQARVVALPSQTCIYRQQICDADFVVKAEVISMKGKLGLKQKKKQLTSFGKKLCQLEVGGNCIFYGGAALSA